MVWSPVLDQIRPVKKLFLHNLRRLDYISLHDKFSICEHIVCDKENNKYTFLFVCNVSKTFEIFILIYIRRCTYIFIYKGKFKFNKCSFNPSSHIPKFVDISANG